MSATKKSSYKIGLGRPIRVEYDNLCGQQYDDDANDNIMMFRLAA